MLIYQGISNNCGFYFKSANIYNYNSHYHINAHNLVGFWDFMKLHVFTCFQKYTCGSKRERARDEKKRQKKRNRREWEENCKYASDAASKNRHLYQHPQELYKWLNAYKFKFISKWITKAMQMLWCANVQILPTVQNKIMFRRIENARDCLWNCCFWCYWHGCVCFLFHNMIGKKKGKAQIMDTGRLHKASRLGGKK